MEFEFSLFNFYRCKKGWQITICEIKRFDAPKSFCILRLTKPRNQTLQTQFLDRKRYSPSSGKSPP